MKNSVILKTVGTDSNGITYPLSVLEQIRDQINSRDNNFGECQMSSSTDVDISNISHKYSDAKIENNALIVTIDVLDTTAGQKLKDAIQQMSENKIKHSFATRSIGSISNDNVIHDKDIKLISVDFKI